MAILLLMQAGATFAMVGLIWTIHFVHYPLMAQVGSGFTQYHDSHCARIAWLVAPLMGLELIGAGLTFTAPMPYMATWEIWLGAALVGVCWGVTGLLSVPAHHALARGFDRAAHRRLMRGDLIRTVAWTARGLLVLVWLARGLGWDGAGV